MEAFDKEYGFLKPREPVFLARIDLPRLAVQWLVVAALVGVAMVVTRPGRDVKVRS